MFAIIFINVKVSLSEIKECVHQATGVFVWTIERILEEGNTVGMKKSYVPEKSKPRTKSVGNWLEYQRRVRDMIYNVRRTDERRDYGFSSTSKDTRWIGMERMEHIIKKNFNRFGIQVSMYTE